MHDRELIFVANADEFTEVNLDRVRNQVPGSTVLRLDEEASLGQCLNEARRFATGDYIAKFDDDDHYGDAYLADLLLAFAYTDAAVVGKQCYFAYLEGRDETVLRFPGREFREAPRVVGGTILADRSLTDHIMFDDLPRGTDTTWLEAVRDQGLTVYSADRYNFCQVRRADVSTHTWKPSDAEFLRPTNAVAAGFAREAIFV